MSFGYDPDEQFIFSLTVWVTGLKTQSLFGMDICQKQVSGILFNLPGIKKKPF